MNPLRVLSSFRDPSGFLFLRDSVLLRQINACYKENYRALMDSGLYARLVEKKLLIPHREVDAPPFFQEGAFLVIRPEKISFISYPYEWCFSQLKDAALLTLRIQKEALNAGMILKDEIGRAHV